MNTCANPSDEEVEVANRFGNMMRNETPAEMRKMCDQAFAQARQNAPAPGERANRMKPFQRMSDGSLYTSFMGDGAQTKLKGAKPASWKSSGAPAWTFVHLSA
jgi:hypothetical protein